MEHFGVQQTNRDGKKFDPLVDADRCRGEFLPFKRLVARNKGEERDGQFQYLRPTELMKKLFDTTNRDGNRAVFQGKV